MKKENKKAYEPGKIASGVSNAIRVVLGLAVFLLCAAVAVLAIYLTVKGGLWIWRK